MPTIPPLLAEGAALQDQPVGAVLIELVHPTAQIEAECKTDLGRRSIALTYAFAIRQIDSSEKAEWSRINTAILDRFGTKGLEWIKTRAWSYVDGAIEPGSKKDRP